MKFIHDLGACIFVALPNYEILLAFSLSDKNHLTPFGVSYWLMSPVLTDEPLSLGAT